MVHYKTRDKPAREELFLTTGTRLVVSNLHPNVSDRDIIELFSAVGDLQSACFIDNGVAEVIYYRSGDADTAFKRYHNRNLDGRPMIIKVGVVKPAAFRETGVFDRTVRRVDSYHPPLSDDHIGFSVRF
jgi:RNA recognition motif-containing protein